MPVVSFLVSSASTQIQACSTGPSFNIYFNAAPGQCDPCLPLTCWPCVNTSDQFYADAGLTTLVADGYYMNQIQPGTYATWYVIGGFPQSGGFMGCSVFPTPTPTSSSTPVPATPTPTPTTTSTPTLTPSITPSITPTKSVTPTITKTPTLTPTVTATPVSPTPTPTNTATPTVTPSVTSSPLPVSGINFKTIADDMSLVADKHKFINSFGLGDTDQIAWWITLRDNQENPTFESPIFPLYFVVPSRVENNLRYKTWEFNNIVMDIVEDDLFNQVETLSDTLQTLQDIMSQFRLSNNPFFGDFNRKYWIDDTVNCTPFLEKYQDNCNGWNAVLRIKTMTPLDRCAAAFKTFTGTPINREVVNLKTLKEDLEMLSVYHKQINSFGFGDMNNLIYWTEKRDKVDNVTFESPIYPLMYVIPGNTQQVITEDGSSWVNYQVNVMILDILERDMSNQIDVLSDTNQMLDDIISQFRLSVNNALGNFNQKYYLDETVICNPFIEKFDDLCGGWNGILNIKVMNPLDRCAAAFDTFIPTPIPTNTSLP